MNSVHDMGGMHGMGPIEPGKNNAMIPERWEARVAALRNALGVWRKWNIHGIRYSIEQIPAADYLRMSYYEKWFASLIELIVKSGLATRTEIESGKPAPGSVKATPPPRTGNPPRQAARVPPRFRVGQRVRARNMNPVGHTRLPRYVRGKSGTIMRDHGVYDLPDTMATLRGENQQHVYSVRFAARELWGGQVPPRDVVHIDLWDDYLERA